MKRKHLTGIAATLAATMAVYIVVGRAGEPHGSMADTRADQDRSFLTSPTKSTPRRPDAKRPDRGIRVAMSAAFVSQSGLPVYGRIVDYLAKKLDNDCELVNGFSYTAINAMLDAGAVDVGFVCGLPYVLMRDEDEPTIELLAAPVMMAARYKDAPKYYSCVIVRKNSRYASFADLKGCTYAYNDELSNSGYNMPRARLIELGETGGFFGKLLRSGSHEESIRMVATGVADASSVDSLVLDFELARHATHAQQVKTIETLGPAGIPPVVASTKLPAAVRKRIKDALIGMKNDPLGRSILDEALIARFEAVDDSNYDDIRRMKKMAEEAGFTEIK